MCFIHSKRWVPEVLKKYPQWSRNDPAWFLSLILGRSLAYLLFLPNYEQGKMLHIFFSPAAFLYRAKFPQASLEFLWQQYQSTGLVYATYIGYKKGFYSHINDVWRKKRTLLVFRYIEISIKLKVQVVLVKNEMSFIFLVKCLYVSVQVFRVPTLPASNSFS